MDKLFGLVEHDFQLTDKTVINKKTPIWAFFFG